MLLPRPSKRTRLPSELGFRPAASSITPAAISSLLNTAMSANICSASGGNWPVSDCGVAFTIIRKRIWVTPWFGGSAPRTLNAGRSRHAALFFCAGGGRQGGSALRQVHRQAAQRGLLVDVAHVLAGPLHGGDDLVEADGVLAVAEQRQAGGVDRLHRAHGVARDAGA